MLAFTWHWSNGDPLRFRGISDRLGSSLCAGIGGKAGTADIGNLHFAYRPIAATDTISRIWRPTVMAEGKIAAFHGYLDNAHELAAQLGADPRDVSRLYALAVDRWGDDADLHIIGEYCAIVAHPETCCLRLARSPLRAPPLYYFQDAELCVAGSVPRIFFSAGVPHRFNEARLADSLLINYSDQEASWFEGIRRVPQGCVIDVQRGRERRLIRYYDPESVKPAGAGSDREYLEQVDKLFDDGVKACLTGFRRPGATLSAGLDSPQVAVRALAMISGKQKLPTFTFCPDPAYDGRAESWMVGNERPMVERFAAMHPGIKPHFTTNPGYAHDHRWKDFFHLMGGAPSGLCNMYVFHGLFAGAAEQGCDVLLVSDWGNNAFSDKGYWGFVEFLLVGKWRQLWLALRDFPVQERSIFWRFVAQSILPLLPDRAWQRVRRLVFRGEEPMVDVMQPMAAAYREASGADARLKKAGFVFDRYQPWNARQARRLLLQNDDGEAAEIYQAFEQMYGLPQRDPTAFRPLVEFCWSLPTRMFMRDGQMRWLAKAMAKGIMPEEQRANRLNGKWDADWHYRIGRKRMDWLAELNAIADDPRLAGMFDIPRLRAALTDWPEVAETNIRQYARRECAVPRALLAARYIRYVEPRNDS